MKRLGVGVAVVLVLMMVLPRGGSALGASLSPLASCEPDCSGTTNGDKVVDPENCNNYYYCFNGNPANHPNSCGNTSHFDPITLECVPGAECEPLCGGGGSGCPLTCNDTTLVVANPYDCKSYYYCTPGGPVPGYCSDPNPFFDGTECTYDESVCCSGYCEPYCDGTSFAILPDPNDCTSFYVCEEGTVGDPGEEFKFYCGDGKVFNIALGNCETGDQTTCKTLCDAATAEGGGSSSTSSGGGGGGGSSSGSTSGGGDGTTTTTTTSTTTTSTSTTTTTTTTTGDCVSSFTCPEEGYFPVCQTCQPEYFACSGAGVPGVMGSCDDGSVFNPTPGLGFCVLPENCPFT